MTLNYAAMRSGKGRPTGKARKVRDVELSASRNLLAPANSRSAFEISSKHSNDCATRKSPSREG